MMKPVEFKGVKYRSINAMLRAIGISKATYLKRKKEGVPLDAPKNHSLRRKITVDGVIYSSIKNIVYPPALRAAAIDTGLARRLRCPDTAGR